MYDVDIAEKIRKVQSKKRFQHTMGVTYTSCALAMHYGADLDKAYYAGLLHDCAKHLKDEKLLSLASKYDLGVTGVEKDNPFLLHGKVGALIAEKTFDISDPEILDAIRYHTTGRPGMSLLEKIVFVADYIEPNRDKAPNLEKVRALAFEDLDLTVIKVIEDTLNYLKDKAKSIDPMTKETHDYYIKERIIHGNI